MKSAGERAISTSVLNANSRVRERVSMGDVAVSLRIMPSGVDADLDYIREETRKIVESKAQLKSIEEKPIAFGLKALEVLFVIPDSAGFSDIESDIAKIEGVESVEAGDITLL